MVSEASLVSHTGPPTRSNTTHIFDRWGSEQLGLPFRVETLLYRILAFLIRQFLGTSPVKGYGALFHPLQRFLSFLDDSSYSHPVFRGFARDHIAPAVNRLALESSDLSFWHDDFFSFQMALQNVSSCGRREKGHLIRLMCSGGLIRGTCNG